MARAKPQGISEEEIQKLVEEQEKILGYVICGYPATVEGEAVVCKNPAGKDTHHFGTGRCRQHGGVGGLVTSGRYIQGKKANSFLEIVKKYEGQANYDNLMKEMAVARGILEDTCESQDLTIHEKALLLKATETISGLVEKQMKIEERFSYTIEDVKSMFTQITNILDTLIEDIALKKKVFTDLAQVTLLKGRSRDRTNDK